MVSSVPVAIPSPIRKRTYARNSLVRKNGFVSLV
jgi:hypothetical protein